MSPAEIQRRIEKMEADLQLEEKMLDAAKRIFDLSNPDNRNQANAQVEGAQKRIRILKSDIEKQHQLLQANATGINPETVRNKNNIIFIGVESMIKKTASFHFSFKN